MQEADVDGFNLFAHRGAGMPGELYRSGGAGPAGARRYKRDYAPGTYRQKLFGAGDRLPTSHPAAARTVVRESGP